MKGCVVSAKLLLQLAFVYASIFSQVLMASTDVVAELTWKGTQHATCRSDGAANMLLTRSCCYRSHSSAQCLNLVRNLAWSAQDVVPVKSVKVVAVLGSCVFFIRRECCSTLVVSVQCADFVFHAQVVVVFRILHRLCKAWSFEALALSAQGVDLELSAQVVVVFRLLHFLCKAWFWGLLFCLHKTWVLRRSCVLCTRPWSFKKDLVRRA